MNQTYCGYIAIIGRPNVGKSTLLNRFLGKKLSITSSKPQTTRYQLLGVKTQENYQAIFVDTPGIHPSQKRKIDRLMNKAATSIISDVDVIVFMINGRKWVEEDETVLKFIQENRQKDKPVILVLNKVDLIKEKKELLPLIKTLSEKYDFETIIPTSITKDTNIDVLEKTIYQHLPEGPFLFPEDQITDRDEKFLTSEIIREKIMRITGQEVPYDIAVVIDNFQYEQKNSLIPEQEEIQDETIPGSVIPAKAGIQTPKKLLTIDATIWVSRTGQKKIIIGERGGKLKEIGIQARKDLQKLFETKVFLRLWVKVKTKWSDDSRLLGQLGF